MKNGRRAHRLLALLLVACLMLPLVGCTKLPEPEYDNTLHLLSKSGVSVFRIVYPQSNCPEEIAQGASLVHRAMQHMLGVEVNMVSDRDLADASDLVLPYEILIGKTARRETTRVLEELGQDEWTVRMVGNKLIVVGKSHRATEEAIAYFVTNILGYTDDATPKNTDLGIPATYAYSAEYRVPLIANQEPHSTMPRATWRATYLYPVSTEQNEADALTIATLQGLAAAYHGEQIIWRDAAYEAYLPELQKMENLRICELTDDGEAWTLSTLLRHYARHLDGYLLCDVSLTEQSVGVAISLAHQLNAVVVTPENEQTARDAGLACVLDVRGRTDEWMRQSEYFSALNTTVAVEQSAKNAPYLIDYAVMSGCYYYYYDGSDAYAHAQRFKFLDEGARVLLGSNASHNDMRLSLADIDLQPVNAGQICNLSTMSGFSCSGALLADDAPTESEKVHTVAFVIQGEDALQWFADDFITAPGWYASSLRGEVDVNWSLPATLCELAPPILNYFGASATERDDFLLTLTAPGYTYSADWQDDARRALADRVAKTMQCVGMSQLLVPSDMGADEQMLTAFAEQDAVAGIVYAGMLEDATGAGDIRLIGDTPVVSMRGRLTSSAVDGTPEAIVQMLNSLPNDPSSPYAYSVIIIDARVGLDEDGIVIDGGDTMAAVKAIVDGLEEQVQIVSLSELMTRIDQNLK